MASKLQCPLTLVLLLLLLLLVCCPCTTQAKVALVTRNTTASVDAFFGLVGQEWRGLFDEIRTREHKYVKPDKRLLLELAEVCVTWGVVREEACL
jgi:hypothetical protein